MPVAVAQGFDAQRLPLIALGERYDRPRHGCREEQSSPFLRRGIEDLFKLLAKAHVEHLVCFVEHRHPKRGKVERAALQVVTKAPRSPDDDVRAASQAPPLLHWVHSTNTSNDTRPGV